MLDPLAYSLHKLLLMWRIARQIYVCVASKQADPTSNPDQIGCPLFKLTSKHFAG